MTDILITKKNIILDATILSTLMSCPRLTDFRFNKRLVSINGKGPSLEKGSIVHAALEAYYKAIRNGIVRTDAIQAAYDSARAYIASIESTSLSDEDITSCMTTLEQYFDYYKNDIWTPIYVEYVKSDLVYEDEEIRILWKAKLDLAVDTNQGIYPVDHKTYSQRKDTISLNNQFMGQCIVMKTRSIIINKIGFQKTIPPKDKFMRLVLSYSSNRLVEWTQTILPYYAKQMLAFDEMNYWPPNFTHCENKYSNCNFVGICSSDTGMREEELRLNFIKGEKWDPVND